MDLSQPFSKEMPHRSVIVPPFEVNPSEIPKTFETGPGRMRTSAVKLGTHMGTHVDAEFHFYEGGQSIDAYPVKRFVGPGVVLPILKGHSGPITAEELDRAKPGVERNDILLLRTGWDEKYFTEAYFDHPYLSDDAARWIIEKGVSIVGIDTLTVDLPSYRRRPEFNFPVHRSILGAGILIIENLGNLRAVEGRRLLIAAIPIKLQSLDAAPARVVGFVPQ